MPEVLSRDWLINGSPHVWRPYCQHATAPPPLAITGSEGSRLLLADGRQLVDGTASWWTAAHGYRHPHIRARVQAQLEQLPHIAFGGLAHGAGYTLASRIAAQLPEALTGIRSEVSVSSCKMDCAGGRARAWVEPRRYVKSTAVAATITIGNNAWRSRKRWLRLTPRAAREGESRASSRHAVC